MITGGHPNPHPEPVESASGAGRVVALTFDDGPNGEDTSRLLDVLSGHGIRAVFCVVGQQVRDGGAELVQRIVAEGHVLANHSMSYEDMGAWGAARVREDLVETLATIREALGDADHPVPYWRAPNGTWGVTCAVAVELGMQPLGATGAIGDWLTQDVDVLERRLWDGLIPGGMVVAHDGGGPRAGTVEAVARVIDRALAEGWAFTLPAR